jgi:hypothetical protein
MTWFAGKIVVWSRSDAEKDEDDPSCHLWERTVVVEADDVDDATRMLTEFGRADAAANSGDAQESGVPDGVGDELIFMGVRNVREVGQLGAGADEEPVEVMFSELEVKNRADLQKFVDGQTVIVRYIG